MEKDIVKKIKKQKDITNKKLAIFRNGVKGIKKKYRDLGKKLLRLENEYERKWRKQMDKPVKQIIHLRIQLETDIEKIERERFGGSMTWGKRGKNKNQRQKYLEDLKKKLDKFEEILNREEWYFD